MPDHKMGLQREEIQAPAAPAKAANAGKERLKRLKGNPKFLAVAAVLLICLMAVGVLYIHALQGRVYIENAEIYAPIISLSPAMSGILEKVLVKEGDTVHKNNIVARVSSTEIRSKTDGLVVGTMDTIGQTVTPQSAIVQLIDPRDFKVIGHIDEDKGLSEIHPGQKVTFTLDAYGSKEYSGVVDSIRPTARQADIVFSISDKRQIRQFDVKAVFDPNAYPEIKNGMSAKMWVYK